MSETGERQQRDRANLTLISLDEPSETRSFEKGHGVDGFGAARRDRVAFFCRGGLTSARCVRWRAAPSVSPA
jgi:hypothetical protein